jgi:hypothetical protein
MNDEGRKEDPFVNELLEASLARYRSEEPRLGLETRVLAGVQAKEQAVRRKTWLFALGAVAATVLVIFAGIYVARRRPAPASPIVSESAPSRFAPPVTSPPPKGNSLEHRRELVTRRALRASRRTRPTPRRPEQFPTPAPLSEEEKLLLAYVSQAPKSDLSKPIIRDPEIDPLEIPQLSVAMIEIKELPRLNQ